MARRVFQMRKNFFAFETRRTEIQEERKEVFQQYFSKNVFQKKTNTVVERYSYSLKNGKNDAHQILSLKNENTHLGRSTGKYTFEHYGSMKEHSFLIEIFDWFFFKNEKNMFKE